MHLLSWPRILIPALLLSPRYAIPVPAIRCATQPALERDTLIALLTVVKKNGCVAQDYAPWTGERSKQALVSSLLLLIAQTSADASSGSGDSGGAPEGLLLGRPEIGALAAQLLQLLLLLYGACEEAKLYAGGSQATRSVTQLWVAAPVMLCCALRCGRTVLSFCCVPLRRRADGAGECLAFCACHLVCGSDGRRFHLLCCMPLLASALRLQLCESSGARRRCLISFVQPVHCAPHRSNDRVELDRVLLECLSHEAKLRQTGAHTAVLSCLPPRDRARLLGFYVAEAHANRHFVDDIAPELKLAHQYYEENRCASQNISMRLYYGVLGLLNSLIYGFYWGYGRSRHTTGANDG